MGDVGETFKLHKKALKLKREKALASANPEGWTVHTEYHWSKSVDDSRLDYWPSKNKFMYKGRVMHGNVNEFIARRLKKK